jgi:hypothetical protein
VGIADGKAGALPGHRIALHKLRNANGGEGYAGIAARPCDAGRRRAGLAASRLSVDGTRRRCPP